jgi:hypothetical protein
MECGFFHPDRGYWQTIGEPSAEIREAYPAGTVEVPLKPGPNTEWTGTEWVPSGPAPEPEPDPKLTGIEFEGVMCSATADDQNGLAAVLLAIQMQGSAFQPTRFFFANGNTLVISLENYQAFAAVWLPFRQSFFQP